MALGETSVDRLLKKWEQEDRRQRVLKSGNLSAYGTPAPETGPAAQRETAESRIEEAKQAAAEAASKSSNSRTRLETDTDESYAKRLRRLMTTAEYTQWCEAQAKQAAFDREQLIKARLANEPCPQAAIVEVKPESPGSRRLVAVIKSDPSHPCSPKDNVVELSETACRRVLQAATESEPRVLGRIDIKVGIIGRLECVDIHPVSGKGIYQFVLDPAA